MEQETGTPLPQDMNAQLFLRVSEVGVSRVSNGTGEVKVTFVLYSQDGDGDLTIHSTFTQNVVIDRKPNQAMVDLGFACSEAAKLLAARFGDLQRQAENIAYNRKS